MTQRVADIVVVQFPGSALRACFGMLLRCQQAIGSRLVRANRHNGSGAIADGDARAYQRDLQYMTGKIRSRVGGMRLR